jgi:hypothetical protein
MILPSRKEMRDILTLTLLKTFLHINRVHLVFLEEKYCIFNLELSISI